MIQKPSKERNMHISKCLNESTYLHLGQGFIKKKLFEIFTVLVFFNPSRESYFTAPLSSFFQSLNTLSAKKFFLKSWLD